MSDTSPLLQQYRDIKARHTGAILFFRMGDFYEMFYDDAQIAARTLNITLTARGDGVPLAGVPVKAAAGYLRQFIAQGYRVAICEQIEDPRAAKGIVKRAVVETITPGAFLDEEWTPGSRNNWLVAIMPAADSTGIAALDLSTGEFLLETLAGDGVAEALSRLTPAEIVVPAGSAIVTSDGMLRTEREPWEFDPALAGEELARRLQLASLDGLGISADDHAALGAAGALLRYALELQPQGVPHLARPQLRKSGELCWIDDMTRRNLELVEPLRAGAKGVTLVEALDRTATPMGARLLRQWVLSPLCQPERINARLDAVAILASAARVREELRTALDGVRDVERLAARAAAGRANPRELGALRDSFARLPDIAAAIAALAALELPGRNTTAALLAHAAEHFDTLADLAADLTRSLVERPPVALADGDVIAPSCDATLDDLRDLRQNGKEALAGIQQRERERTGIASLKVGYNKVFGYYLEITHANAGAVPTDYERRQTLSNAERYVTPELKDYESRVLGAEERIGELENALFAALRSRVGQEIARIQGTAQLLARIDVLASLAEVAVTERYVRPVVDDSYELTLTGSRHPVIERMMPRERFVPNDVHFDEAARVLLVTGPNMAGKSTILRQIGLCALLAQIGSFVPAKAARIGVADRLFTRVGASDNLARGQSTFMVEMSETSAILHNATRRSLVLLDEIGRGTSTYDGVAIAWAVTEHLHDRIGCRTMFATHYHELMQLPERLAHARNMNVAVRDTGGRVVFLHRLEAGGTDRSYGIHVAQLAGLPATVVGRAQEVLGTLETGHRVVPGDPPRPPDPAQPTLFDTLASPQARQPTAEERQAAAVTAQLRQLDPDQMTPIQALQELARLRDGLQ
ncbi:MAG TPA: DNA mismatch repair protein MutS [Gemmatimonadales bacterium]|nr:DNA mismatch repair protein MutS [Gemmatimonadales bacterium]